MFARRDLRHQFNRQHVSHESLIKYLKLVTPRVTLKLDGTRLQPCLVRHASSLVPAFRLTCLESARAARSKVLLTAVRHYSGQAGSSQVGISRSKSVTIPVTRNTLPSQAYRHSATPVVVVDSPPDEVPDASQCRGLVCPFYGHDPIKHARCHNECTVREGNPLNKLKRHLRTHAGDVPDETLEAAIECLGVRNTDNDNRRRRSDKKVPEPDKVAHIYRRCRQVLFGVDGSVPIQYCPLPDTHFKRRRRASNKMAEEPGERVSQSRTQTRRRRASSGAYSLTTVNPQRDVFTRSWRFEAGLMDATSTSIFQDRMESLTRRLSRLFEVVSTDPDALSGLYSTLEHFHIQLDELETRSHIGSDNIGFQGSLGPVQPQYDYADPTSIEHGDQFMLPNLPQSGSDMQQIVTENDIDLTNDNNHSASQSSSAWLDPSVLNDDTADTTWQQKTFGTQIWSQEVQHDPLLHAHTIALGHANPPSLTSMASTSFLRHSVPPSVQVQWDSMSSPNQVCDLCHMYMSVCNGDHQLWPTNG